MVERYIRVVSLWIQPEQEVAFDAFERDAARIMAKHRGRIDHAVRLTPPAGAGLNDATPYELHIVSFPDREAAESYANDPEAVDLRPRREKIIARTMVMTGREAGPY